MKIVLVCGARPNFMKIAPLLRAIAKHNELNRPNEAPISTHLNESPVSTHVNKLNEPNKLPPPPLWESKAAKGIVEIIASRRYN